MLKIGEKSPLIYINGNPGVFIVSRKRTGGSGFMHKALTTCWVKTLHPSPKKRILKIFKKFGLYLISIVKYDIFAGSIFPKQ